KRASRRRLRPRPKEGRDDTNQGEQPKRFPLQRPPFDLRQRALRRLRVPAPDLVNGDRNQAVDVFLRDRKRGRTTLLSVSSEGTQGNSDSSFPVISANGRFVAFSSLASNLVEGDRHNTADTFVRGPLRPSGRF